MNGVMNENQLTVVREYEFGNPLIQKIDSRIDDCIRDCYYKIFHTFDHICENDLKFTKIANNETINFTISAKSMGLSELNKKLTVARQRGYIISQINKLTKKISSFLSHINIHYYLKLRIPIMHRQFFRKLAQNCDYIQTHCNDRRNLFHFACPQWYSYYNSQFDMV